MAVLVLIKHSMPECDSSIPASEWHLSAVGKERCRWLSGELENFQLTMLCTSVEPKAHQTAEIVGARLGIPIRAVGGLHENDRTDFPYFNDKAIWVQRFKDFFNNPEQRLIGHEAAREALVRFKKSVIGIIKENPAENIGIVAHGTVISLFTAHYNALQAYDVWASLNPLPAYLALTIPGFEIAKMPTAFRG